MNKPGESERASQNRIVQLFQSSELGYRYLGDWQEREGNSNIEEALLAEHLTRRGYSQAQINKAVYELSAAATNFSEDSLYTTNKNVYRLLRYGVKVKLSAGENYQTIPLFDWEHPLNNDFAIAEEVTIQGSKEKRPDIVIYINGIALGVIELKRGSTEIGEGIRQNITNQQERFIRDFFSTVQLLFAGNDTEGLRYGTIGTEAKYYLNWKEDVEDTSRLVIDKYLIKMCNKDRLIDLLHNFVLFDGGIKKLPRVHQYFGIKAAQQFVSRYEGGIIWHTQGSGKSIAMVLLTQWVLENNPNARVVVLTDRIELDKQIRGVFNAAGESVEQVKSGKDLMAQLALPKPRLLCSLIFKFGKKASDKRKFNEFIKELEANPVQVSGELFVLVDECHRTQSGKLHKTMKVMLPKAVFIGFTGTPLLKADKKTSQQVFGRYIHTYKFNEGVEDKIILDLMYEARDVDQWISSERRVEEWFEAKTRGLNDFQKSEIKKKWGTMQKVLSSRSRMDRIVMDIVHDFDTKPVISDERGNAILVASSIYEASRYFDLFQKTTFKGKCALITSYSPHHGDVTTEDTGANSDTDKEALYNLYQDLLKDVQPDGNKSKVETYEDRAKQKFIEEPANMKLLIVVAKLLTGFDAPSCTYLYIDKKMQDHGLFQAICRTNRLNGEEKEFGYIVDYQDLFNQVGEAISVYTSDLDTEDFDLDEIDITLKDRLAEGKKRLDNALEAIALLCEPVPAPKDKVDYQRYFCGNTEIAEALKATELRRNQLYKNTVALIRAYANIADEMEEAGYTVREIAGIKREIDHYLKLREEIRMASKETLDLKDYEADMRHLIDTYIQAADPETISPFGGLSLLEIISSEGVQAAIDSLPKGNRGSQGAIAETIERNVRSTIIKEHDIDPAYFEKMGRLLDELIRLRREKAISYEEYLRRIEELAKQTNAGRSDDTPTAMDTSGKRALYNNLGENESLVLKVDEAVKTNSPADWRGHTVRENMVKRSIYDALLALREEENTEDLVKEPPSDYGIMEKVEKVFSIIKEHPEY